jgi:hypothetical protein
LYNQTHAQFAQEGVSFFRKIIDGIRYIFSDSYIVALALLKTSTVVALGPIDVVCGHSYVHSLENSLFPIHFLLQIFVYLFIYLFIYLFSVRFDWERRNLL